jgi:hypothetical protein
MSLKNRSLAAALATLALVPAAALAQSDVTLYHNTFEARQIGSEWSRGTVLNWDHRRSFTTFNGRYSGGSTTLTLAQPAIANPWIPGGARAGEGGEGEGGEGGGGGDTEPRVIYAVTFDLYAIDSWDGSVQDFGPDRFRVSVNGTSLLDTTITTHEGQAQDFRAPDLGPVHLGFRPDWKDSIYRNVTLEFTLADHTAPIAITWSDLGLQGLNDESWGIDNVGVTYRVVPAPGAAGLSGGLLLTCLRRRRAGGAN